MVKAIVVTDSLASNLHYQPYSSTGYGVSVHCLLCALPVLIIIRLLSQCLRICITILSQIVKAIDQPPPASVCCNQSCNTSPNHQQVLDLLSQCPISKSAKHRVVAKEIADHGIKHK